MSEQINRTGINPQSKGMVNGMISGAVVTVVGLFIALIVPPITAENGFGVLTFVIGMVLVAAFLAWAGIRGKIVSFTAFLLNLTPIKVDNGYLKERNSAGRRVVATPVTAVIGAMSLGLITLILLVAGTLG